MRLCLLTLCPQMVVLGNCRLMPPLNTYSKSPWWMPTCTKPRERECWGEREGVVIERSMKIPLSLQMLSSSFVCPPVFSTYFFPVADVLLSLLVCRLTVWSPVKKADTRTAVIRLFFFPRCSSTLAYGGSCTLLHMLSLQSVEFFRKGWTQRSSNCKRIR